MNVPKNEPIRVLVVLIACFVFAWGISWWAMIYYMKDWPERGSFGDMFGSINALFSGVVLAGVIYTIYLQRKELQLQRHELELTRNELQRSAEAHEKSEEALRQQIKQMQEQSELQLMPFVVITLHQSYSLGCVLTNAGNGTAINIKVYTTVNKENNGDLFSITTNVSFLKKGEEQRIEERSKIDVFKDEKFYIEFSNINRKEYFTQGKFKNGKTEVEKFGQVPQ